MARWSTETKLLIEELTFKVLMERGEIFPLGGSSGLTGAWQTAQKYYAHVEYRENPTRDELPILKKNLNARFNSWCSRKKIEWEKQKAAEVAAAELEKQTEQVMNVLDKLRKR